MAEPGTLRSRKFNRRSISHPLYATPLILQRLQDTSDHDVGFVGPITEAGVILVKSRSLVCLDLTSGELVWRRELEKPDQQVFGDAEFLFVCGFDDEMATVLRTRDGYVLGNKPVPVGSNRWVTDGRLVLQWGVSVREVPADQDVPKEVQTEVKLYDPWREAVLWTETFAPGSRGTLLPDSTMAVLEPEGRFVVRRLRDEPPLVAANLLATKQLAAIQTLQSGNQLLLGIATEAKSGGGGVNINTMGTVLPSIRLNGPLYCFDLQTGQPNWESPAQIEDYLLPLTQPTDLPVLWLLRHSSTPQSRTGPQNTDMTAVVCLDRRDGRLLFQKEPFPSDPNSYEFDVDLEALTVSMSLSGQTFKLHFTEQPVAPEPPAQLIEPSTTRPRGGILQRATNAAIRAIINGPQN